MEEREIFITYIKKGRMYNGKMGTNVKTILAKPEWIFHIPPKISLADKKFGLPVSMKSRMIDSVVGASLRDPLIHPLNLRA